MPKVTRIDHIAILSNDIQENIYFWRDALGLDLRKMLDVPAEQSRVAFLPVGNSEIEIVQPTSQDSGLARCLEKRGAGMHHICLEVDDIHGMISVLRGKGIQLIHEVPKKSPDGKEYAFIHPKSANGVLVELYELPAENPDK
jgi:methylmalonyl-CoA/ethylmalonyl-CoA epimerase